MSGSRLAGKVAVVTGAGSVGPGWGNGRAAAVLFAREGAKVVVVDREPQAAAETKRLIDEEKGEAFTSQTDVTELSSVTSMAEAALARFGRIDVLLNNVGGSITGGPVEMSVEDFRDQIDLNLTSVFITCKVLLPAMIARGGGAIINVGSIGGLRHLGHDHVGYSAAKAALVQFTRQIAVRHAHDGIRCNTVIPGMIDTPLLEHRVSRQKGRADLATLRSEAATRVPLGRRGEAWDVAYAALFLASDEAKYVTGTEILVDGGLMARSADSLNGESIMQGGRTVVADSTAARVALWRALHLEVDAPPHVLEDEIGLRLVAPDEHWRSRPDMEPHFTRLFRASIVARARFIEDLVAEQAGRGVGQYVILGAGLDTFAQRKPEIASRLRLFEVDQPGPQAWKRRRLIELGFGIPHWLRLVPVDFEAGDSWWQRLADAGFDAGRRAVVASTGVSMYLTKDAIVATLRQVAALVPGSTLAMTFLLPLGLADPEVRPGLEAAEKGARASGTPFISFFTPTEMLALARDAGFREARHVSAATLAERYFAGRADGLRPPSNAEELLVATT